MFKLYYLKKINIGRFGSERCEGEQYRKDYLEINDRDFSKRQWPEGCLPGHMPDRQMPKGDLPKLSLTVGWIMARVTVAT